VLEDWIQKEKRVVKLLYANFNTKMSVPKCCESRVRIPGLHDVNPKSRLQV
jgi:hypothetical protein